MDRHALAAERRTKLRLLARQQLPDRLRDGTAAYVVIYCAGLILLAALCAARWGR
jgi:hypothetical protein